MWHPIQLQLRHFLLFFEHMQYFFRQFDFLQLQVVLWSSLFDNLKLFTIKNSYLLRKLIFCSKSNSSVMSVLMLSLCSNLKFSTKSNGIFVSMMFWLNTKLFSKLYLHEFSYWTEISLSGKSSRITKLLRPT